MKTFFLILACILIPFTAFALEPMATNPPGDLHVSVFITDTPKFIKEWVETPPSHAPTIKRIKKAKYNQMVHAGFAITGFSKGIDSKLNLVVAVQILAPDGTIILQEDNWAVHNKEIKIEKGIIIADPVLDLTIEQNDPPGNYKISVIVTDFISGKKASDSAILTIN